MGFFHVIPLPALGKLSKAREAISYALSLSMNHAHTVKALTNCNWFGRMNQWNVAESDSLNAQLPSIHAWFRFHSDYRQRRRLVIRWKAICCDCLISEVGTAVLGSTRGQSLECANLDETKRRFHTKNRQQPLSSTRLKEEEEDWDEVIEKKIETSSIFLDNG